MLPPVPSQPFMYVPSTVSQNGVSTSSLVLTSSQYSTEYNSAMTGCLLHYGQSPYNPSGIPTTLTSSTTVPTNSSKYLGVAQGNTQTVTPASFSSPPTLGVPYDYHFTCYNGNGPSPEVILYNIVTTKNGATSRYSTASIMPALLGLMAVAMGAVTLLV